MADRYTDSEGRECALDTLCRREPEWAANRIRALVGDLAKARARLSVLTDAFENRPSIEAEDDAAATGDAIDRWASDALHRADVAATLAKTSRP